MRFSNKFYCAVFAGAIGFLGVGSPALSADGSKLFEENCASCHIGSGGTDERIAPPIFGVQNHYFDAYPSEEKFVAAIVSWLEEPSEDKSLMPGAISKFGLMPPLEISREEATLIGEFLYDARFDQPGWYEEHYRKEHGEAPPSGGMGQMGKGHGMGQGHGMGNGYRKGKGMGDGHGRSWWQRLWSE